MVVIGQAILDDNVLDAKFACDLDVCKGACCCLPGARGAPLEDDEVLEIRKVFPAIRSLLPPASLSTIAPSGLVEGSPGDYATSCVNDGDCVFVFRENGIAKCAFERAFLDGRTDWRKPISCHLFPLRIRQMRQEYVRYEQIPECKGGRARGEREDTGLLVFVRDALLKKYGPRWYAQLPGPMTGKS